MMSNESAYSSDYLLIRNLKELDSPKRNMKEKMKVMYKQPISLTRKVEKTKTNVKNEVFGSKWSCKLTFSRGRYHRFTVDL